MLSCSLDSVSDRVVIIVCGSIHWNVRVLVTSTSYLTCIDITAASPKINDQQSGVNYAYVLSLLYSQ